MKKVLCLLLAIFLVGGMFTACGGENGKANGGKTGKENSSDNSGPSEVYLIEHIVRVMNAARLHRNEEGIVTSFDYGYEKEYICEYDANGNLSKISLFHYNERDGKRVYGEQAQKVWDFTYDAEGKLTQYIAGEDDPWTYQYDANGHLTTIRLYQDADVEVRYAYDDQGRVIGRRVWNNNGYEKECSFTYDDSGKLIQYIDNDTTYTYSYDADGKVTSYDMLTATEYRTIEQKVICKYDDNGCMVEQEIQDQGMMYEVKYVSMELTPQQAQRAQENTEYILSFCNLLLMPNAIYFDRLIN